MIALDLNVSLPNERFKIPLKVLERENGRLYLQFGYNKALIDEVKCFGGAKYHGYDDSNPEKIWSIAKSTRNIFTLNFMQGKKVYANYDKPLIDVDFTVDDLHTLKPYTHQRMMTRHMLTRRCCIVAGEMGTGKTRSAGMAMDRSGLEDDWWFVGTKASIRAVEYDFRKWKFKTKPRFMTYEQLVKIVTNWTSGERPPCGVVFDESSRLKNASAKRSQCAFHLAESMRNEHGVDNIYVILMSGSPSPKSPEDWWHQAEIACPGYLREGNPNKFKERLCLITKNESASGGWFPKIETWWDNEDKCQVCGQFASHENHIPDPLGFEQIHKWVKSKNEVVNLYKRLSGLVMVYFKKDCLKELPEKRYEKIILTPTESTMRTLKSVCRTARGAAQALVLAREISDGFLYMEKKNGTKTCPTCNGTKKHTEYYDPDNPDAVLLDEPNDTRFKKREADCRYCTDGQVDSYETITHEVPCPKEDALIDLLEQHEEVGRIVVYAGFQGSIDRCERVMRKQGWAVIRVDGGGWKTTDALGNVLSGDPLVMFQEQLEEYDKVAFLGHPGSAGMGLTLTASPSIVYYSNDFNAESRIQSEDRIHRPGMDVNRGATIFDLFHCPTDEYIYNNLQKKRDLQNLSMGDLSSILDNQTSQERVL